MEIVSFYSSAGRQRGGSWAKSKNNFLYTKGSLFGLIILVKSVKEGEEA